jgi:phosphoribosyl-AMP cyclohydrolase
VSPKPLALPEKALDQVKFDDRGLVPVIAQEEGDREVLMLAWANREALLATLRTGQGHYWSRSRRELWRKGGTSGHEQEVVEMRIDCDGDTVLYLVRQTGPACHLNRRSCFTSFQE